MEFPTQFANVEQVETTQCMENLPNPNIASLETATLQPEQGT